ncbi:GAF domain-containing protein [Rhodococcus sp. 14-2470-1b]|uniref:GAF domain-containing protein n=1 Tax=Rhodococcus sp. 14-2470-1b TaxID=2023149 RepID=UPI00159524AE|nr:GAF domain-containing protein [Rhodococcus sp. 14-2470-1b]
MVAEDENYGADAWRFDIGGTQPSDALSGHQHLPTVAQVSAGCVSDAGVDGAAVAILTDDADARDLLYATNSHAARIDELQFTTGEGPCLDAFVTGAAQLHADIGSRPDTTGWPSFASEVVQELGVHGVFAFPLFSGGARLGVLELYRQRPSTLTALQLAAAQTAAAALGEAVITELSSYPQTFDHSMHRAPAGPYRFARSDISIAVGVLAARLHVSTSDASARLRARAYADARSISSLSYDIVHGDGAFYEDPGSN